MPCVCSTKAFPRSLSTFREEAGRIQCVSEHSQALAVRDHQLDYQCYLHGAYYLRHEKGYSMRQSNADHLFLGSHNRHMRSHQGPASQRVATSLDCPKRTVQNCVGRSYTPDLRSYRPVEMGLVPRQRIKRHD
jgi:hypothetical protein